ncbi:Lysine acetyltransferase [Pleurostoma richardsiae]|uniref:Lysine acetyltransferase n=1 Tax=Pleurostoma richardsiae TaxID=41990 RepID=A0AA38R7T9_9PEZI|nr:Lysine acetyltransferase [Pleurostoma richardsiae]
MGSSAPAELPSASSPSLVLTHPTPAEKRRTWTLSHAMWGGALKLDDYLRREEYLATVPVAKDGGMTHWILTDGSLPPDARPILSSCETLTKRAIACRAGGDGGIQEGVAFGIASVFTDPQFRGRGYARRMMNDLGPALSGQSEEAARSNGPGSRPLFSVLYSDIGKEFYTKSGWAPFESSHLAFTPAPSLTPAGGEPASTAKPIGYHELAELCAADERLLRARLARQARELEAAGAQKKVCVALVPNLDTMLWHLMREDYMTKHIFGRTPTVRGAVFGEPGRRVWAVWTRGYYGGLQTMEGNTLHVLRVAVEDEEQISEDYLGEGFRSIVQIAQAEAAEWHSQDVQMWNPSPLLRRAADRSGIKHEFVERDKESIASLMPYTGEAASEVDWVLNEKFGWC